MIYTPRGTIFLSASLNSCGPPYTYLPYHLILSISEPCPRKASRKTRVEIGSCVFFQQFFVLPFFSLTACSLSSLRDLDDLFARLSISLFSSASLLVYPVSLSFSFVAFLAPARDAFSKRCFALSRATVFRPRSQLPPGYGYY